MPVTNDVLAERISGLEERIAASIAQVDQKVEALNTKVGIQNGRVGRLEAASLIAKTKQDVLDQLAVDDRQTTRDAENTSWNRWQKLLGVGGIVCALLAGAGGLVELLIHIHP